MPENNSDRAARREKRKERLSRRRDASVPSPCIALCQIDDATQLCIGCRRNPDEIREWIIMTRDEKLAVLSAIEQRLSVIKGTMTGQSPQKSS